MHYVMSRSFDHDKKKNPKGILWRYNVSFLNNAKISATVEEIYRENKYTVY